MRLKELRIKAGLSQQQLAFKLNTTQNTISRYENNQREMDYQTLIDVAELFNVSIDYLLGRTDIPTFPLANTNPSNYERCLQSIARSRHQTLSELLDDVLNNVLIEKSKKWEKSNKDKGL
ncbi:MAG: helix-turn-helix transcriptional regulator [Ruminococcus sp.]|nr:helix-turn-helix transcriptional regulator [Ruminococcus sp.]